MPFIFRHGKNGVLFTSNMNRLLSQLIWKVIFNLYVLILVTEAAETAGGVPEDHWVTVSGGYGSAPGGQSGGGRNRWPSSQETCTLGGAVCPEALHRSHEWWGMSTHSSLIMISAMAGRDVIDSQHIDIFTLSIKSNRMVGYWIEIIDILNPNNGVWLWIKNTPDIFLFNKRKAKLTKYWSIFYGFCKRNWKEWCTLKFTQPYGQDTEYHWHSYK